ncbi:MAG TPA: Hsp20/alpha crystallin family protein [Flavipsychrobacter sp.]|nr:Hsp20/alpha crystallin family protein [Flavipsychrobacter sp.]
MTSLMKRGNGQAPANGFSGLVDKVFQDNLSRFFNDDFWGFNGVSRAINVPVNLRETDKSYELEVVAPGLRKEDFKVNVQGDVLTIGFEHKEENNQQGQEGWLRREYKQQSFSRAFSLDDNVDANKINATYQDGVLRLSLPKKEGAQSLSRTISIE